MMAEYIDRDEVIAWIWKQKRLSKGYAVMVIQDLPAADVAPVQHGRWIEDHDYIKCPECSVMVKRDFTFFDIGDWNYCPNCGAKMDGAE
nr:MAG TPA: zinc-ribbon domain protein [Caudoviricetes sp.]